MRTAAMVVMLVVLAAACGGSGDDATPTRPAENAVPEVTLPPLATCPHPEIDCAPALRTVTVELWACDGHACEGGEDSSCQRVASLQIGDRLWEPDPFFCLVQFHTVPVGDYLLSIGSGVGCGDLCDPPGERCTVAAAADRIAVVPVAQGECPAYVVRAGATQPPEGLLADDYWFTGFVLHDDDSQTVDGSHILTISVLTSRGGPALETGALQQVVIELGRTTRNCFGSAPGIVLGSVVEVVGHATDYNALEICNDEHYFARPARTTDEEAFGVVAPEDFLFTGVVREQEYACPVDGRCAVTAEVRKWLAGNRLEPGATVTVLEQIGFGVGCEGLGLWLRAEPGDDVIALAHHGESPQLSICDGRGYFVARLP